VSYVRVGRAVPVRSGAGANRARRQRRRSLRLAPSTPPWRGRAPNVRKKKSSMVSGERETDR
jgi:hypothetical protein